MSETKPPWMIEASHAIHELSRSWGHDCFDGCDMQADIVLAISAEYERATAAKTEDD